LLYSKIFQKHFYNIHNVFKNLIGDIPGKVFPEVQHSYVGHTVKITCLSVTPIRWKFSKSIYNAKEETEPGSNKHKLILFNIQVQSTGVYTCYGKDSNGIRFMSSAQIRVVQGNLLSLHVTLLFMKVNLELNHKT